MKFGLSEEVIEKVNHVLSSFPSIEKAILYGSRAKGNYKNGSDIDLCLYGKDLDLALIAKLDFALDDLLLPYTVDLTVYDNLQNEDLIDHINRVGILFFEKKE